MKKIIFFIDSLAGGGAQRQIVGLASSVDRVRYDPMVLTYHYIPYFKPVLDEAGVRVEYIQKRRKLDPIFIFRLVSFLRRERPDILLSYLNTPNMWARIAGRLAGVSRIITSERNIDIEHSWVRMFIERLLKRWGSDVVVNASATRDLLHDRVGIPMEKIHVIYNGIDVERFDNPDIEVVRRLRAEFGLKDGERVILLPGRITPQKNHICLVKAFCNIKKTHNNAKLLFVGEEIDSAVKGRIELELNKFNILGDVIFAGQRVEMNELYYLSDIVVLPSLWEGFPNVILEAMAARRVVVVSDIADNTHLVSNGKTGYLFSSNNHVQLAEILSKLIIYNDADLSAMGEAACTRIKEKYTLSAMVEKYQNLFEQVKN